MTIKRGSVLKELVKQPLLPQGYSFILETISSKIRAAKKRALVAANRELIEIYRDIGKTIYEKQQIEEWGSSVVEQLARDLQLAFPGMKGFSSRNLWIMKDLYISYQGYEKLQTLSAEISWSHNVAILEQCEDSLKKEFYMRISKRNCWSYRMLHLSLVHAVK